MYIYILGGGTRFGIFVDASRGVTRCSSTRRSCELFSFHRFHLFLLIASRVLYYVLTCFDKRGAIILLFVEVPGPTECATRRFRSREHELRLFSPTENKPRPRWALVSFFSSLHLPVPEVPKFSPACHGSARSKLKKKKTKQKTKNKSKKEIISRDIKEDWRKRKRDRTIQRMTRKECQPFCSSLYNIFRFSRRQLLEPRADLLQLSW